MSVVTIDGVTPPNQRRCGTGIVIAGMAAIPFVTVTFAATMADLASTSGSPHGVAGILALVGGLIMGLLITRVISGVRTGLGVARIALERLADQIVRDIGRVRDAGRPLDGRVHRRRPALAFVPAEIGRRGPPRRSS